jgi:hypothetical protein
MQRRVQAFAAYFEFGAQIGLFGRGHRASYIRVLLCGGSFHPISSPELRIRSKTVKIGSTGSLLVTHLEHANERATCRVSAGVFDAATVR